MDEVLTCRCGGREWVIGTTGVRCPLCGFKIEPGLVIVSESIRDANREIRGQKTEASDE